MTRELEGVLRGILAGIAIAVLALGCSRTRDADSTARLQLRTAEQRRKEGRLAAALEILRAIKCTGRSEQSDLHWIRFLCYVDQASEHRQVDKCRSLLTQAQTEVDRVRMIAHSASNADVVRQLSDRYVDMVCRLAEAYLQAMKLARSQGQTGAARGFYVKGAKLLGSVADQPRFQTVNKLIEIASTLQTAGEYEHALKVYRGLLKAFDPDGNRIGIADKAVGDVAYFKRALTGDRDHVRMGCKYLEDFDLYMSGREAAMKGSRVVRPAVLRDYPRALRNLELFFQAFPDYDLAKGRRPGKARRKLAKAKEELELRIGLYAAAHGTTACLLAWGEHLRQDQRAKESADVLQRALANARSEMRYWPNDPKTCSSLALCLLSVGGRENLQEARAIFDKLLTTTLAGGEWHWEALKGAIRTRRALGDQAGADALIKKHKVPKGADLSPALMLR